MSDEEIKADERLINLENTRGDRIKEKNNSQKNSKIDRRKENITISIIGLGVIGGSFAKALKRAGYKKVFGIDIDEKTLEKAKDDGVIVDGFVDAREILPNTDLVIFSIYPEQIVDFLKENKKNFKKDAVLTDTTGIKGFIVEEVTNNLPENTEFIFGHPMAGREGRSYEFSSAEVFDGANYLIVDSEKNNPRNLELLENIIRDMGFKNITYTDSISHDRAISYTSQLSHVIAVSLINSEEKNPDTDRFTGDSYREITRIANINEKLWAELFLNNRENLIHSIDCFVKQVEKMREVLDISDKDKLEEMFKEAKIRRKEIFKNIS